MKRALTGFDFLEIRCGFCQGEARIKVVYRVIVLNHAAVYVVPSKVPVDCNILAFVIRFTRSGDKLPCRLGEKV